MSKTRRKQSSGFSNTLKSQDSKIKPTQSHPEHTAKEQQAIELIKQGKLQEAEAIYKELISTGTNNHIVYGNLASLCGMQGRIKELIGFLNQALQLKPNYPEAHYNLGIALQKQGDLTAAITSYNKALQLKPNYPKAHNNLGNAHKDQGDLILAIASYNTAISLNPNYIDAHNNLGITRYKQGNLTAAIASYNTALKLQPNHPEAHYNLGIALQKQGDLTAAITSYNAATKLRPDYTDAHYNLGLALQEQGDPAAAIASYKTAIKLKPNYPEVHNNLGLALQEQDDSAAAIASYKTAIKLKPNYPEAHNNLGFSLHEQGDPSAAIDSYKTAITLKPNYPKAHNNLGIALHEQGDLSTAISSYKTALKLKPNYSKAHNNLGCALQEQGDLTAAIASYNTALKLKPNYPEAHWNASLTMLLRSDYKNGWEEYKWRTKKKENPATPHALPKCDEWNGDTSLNQSKQLLLVTEQGLGDTLQFMRYAPALREEGISISFCAQPKLHSLIQASGIDPSPLTPNQANEVTEGQWIRLLSVPRYLEVSPENPVISESYINTTEELNRKWADILSSEEQPIIGINWQGNPKSEKTALRERSLALEAFAPIISSRRVSLLSLQKGFGSEQLETCSFKDHFVGCQHQVNETWDFLETAAIIANCDLVITSDTAVAHLAGGMGKTTWLLLHKVPDWRWGLEGNTTFWYPSMRLFRQRKRGNWAEVMQQVVEALQEHFGSSTMPLKPVASPQPVIKPQSKSRPAQDILVPISVGELIDKITILQIKTQHLQGTALENVKQELKALDTTLNNLQLNIDPTLIQCLKEVNQDLWQIEDAIREQERQTDFGPSFIKLARSVYQKNDRRAAIKRDINILYHSNLIEEKAYKHY